MLFSTINREQIRPLFCLAYFRALIDDQRTDPNESGHNKSGRSIAATAGITLLYF